MPEDTPLQACPPIRCPQCGGEKVSGLACSPNADPELAPPAWFCGDCNALFGTRPVQPLPNARKPLWASRERLAPGIDLLNFSHPEHFIEALRPNSELWEGEPKAWIFRGHANSAWELLPS